MVFCLEILSVNKHISAIDISENFLNLFSDKTGAIGKIDTIILESNGLTSLRLSDLLISLR